MSLSLSIHTYIYIYIHSYIYIYIYIHTHNACNTYDTTHVLYLCYIIPAAARERGPSRGGPPPAAVARAPAGGKTAGRGGTDPAAMPTIAPGVDFQCAFAAYPRGRVGSPFRLTSLSTLAGLRAILWTRSRGLVHFRGREAPIPPRDNLAWVNL